MCVDALWPDSSSACPLKSLNKCLHASDNYCSGASFSPRKIFDCSGSESIHHLFYLVRAFRQLVSFLLVLLHLQPSSYFSTALQPKLPSSLRRRDLQCQSYFVIYLVGSRKSSSLFAHCLVACAKFRNSNTQRTKCETLLRASSMSDNFSLFLKHFMYCGQCA